MDETDMENILHLKTIISNIVFDVKGIPFLTWVFNEAHILLLIKYKSIYLLIIISLSQTSKLTQQPRICISYSVVIGTKFHLKALAIAWTRINFLTQEKIEAHKRPLIVEWDLHKSLSSSKHKSPRKASVSGTKTHVSQQLSAQNTYEIFVWNRFQRKPHMKTGMTNVYTIKLCVIHKLGILTLILFVATMHDQHL